MSSTLPFSTPSEARVQRRTQQRGPHGTTSNDVLTTWFVVAASAVGGMMAGAHPAGWRPADVVITGAFAAGVAFSGAYARRWAWLVTGGIAIAAADSGVAVGCAIAAVLVAFAAVALNVRSRTMGAVASGLAMQALLRLPDFGMQGAPSLVAVLALTPLAISAYRYAPGRLRRRSRQVGIYVAAGCGVLAVLGVLIVLIARSSIESGIRQAQVGFDHVQNGDRDEAVASLQQSSSEFDDASGILGAWWAAPVRVLPIGGQQVTALREMASLGTELTRDAADAAAVVDYNQLRVRGGAIDIAMLRAVHEPITRTAAALADAEQRLGELEVGWLFAPVRDRFDLLQHQVERARPAAAIARDVVAIAPTILGEETPQRYLVLFGTPSEARELGGFVGNYAEVTASHGKLSLTRSGRGLELGDPDGNKNWQLTPGDYTEPFLRYRVTQFFGNVSASVNFPDVGNVAAQLYAQSSGKQLDGVFYMDPYALAGLLELTGPINLKDAGVRLTEDNAAQTLLVDQYKQLPKQERIDFLDEATRLAFEKLTTGDLPKPASVSNVMSPMVEQARLLGFSPHPELQQLMNTLGMDGAVPSRGDGDLVYVTHSNANPNKIDAYMQRDISYVASYRPDTGDISADLTVRLTNSAPVEGLAEDVIGNRQGVPVGTNHLFLTVFSPLRASSATIDGDSAGLGSTDRLGLHAYTVVVDVPAGGSKVVTLKLGGTLGRSGYRLTVLRQPTVNLDHIDVVVQGRAGWRVNGNDDLPVSDGVGKVTVGREHMAQIEAGFRG